MPQASASELWDFDKVQAAFKERNGIFDALQGLSRDARDRAPWTLWLRAHCGMHCGAVLLAMAQETRLPHATTMHDEVEPLRAEELRDAWHAAAEAVDGNGGGPLVGTYHRRLEFLSWLLQVAYELGHASLIRDLYDHAGYEIAVGAGAPGKRYEELTETEVGHAIYKGGNSLWEQVRTQNYLELRSLFSCVPEAALRAAPTPTPPEHPWPDPSKWAGWEIPCPRCGGPRHHADTHCHWCGAHES